MWWNKKVANLLIDLPLSVLVRSRKHYSHGAALGIRNALNCWIYDGLITYVTTEEYDIGTELANGTAKREFVPIRQHGQLSSKMRFTTTAQPHGTEATIFFYLLDRFFLLLSCAPLGNK